MKLYKKILKYASESYEFVLTSLIALGFIAGASNEPNGAILAHGGALALFLYKNYRDYGNLLAEVRAIIGGLGIGLAVYAGETAKTLLPDYQVLSKEAGQLINSQATDIHILAFSAGSAAVAALFALTWSILKTQDLERRIEELEEETEEE